MPLEWNSEASSSMMQHIETVTSFNLQYSIVILEVR